MQIIFDVGYRRWVADVSGAELEAISKVFAKAVQCHNTWANEEERKTGVLQVEKGPRLDLDIKVNAQALTLVEWIEPPKPDPQPEAKAATTFKVPQVVTPDIRDFMDEQLASPESAEELL